MAPLFSYSCEILKQHKTPGKQKDALPFLSKMGTVELEATGMRQQFNKSAMKAHIPDEMRERYNSKTSAWILWPPVTPCMF